MTVGHIAGFYHAQILKRDANGYPVGLASDPDDIANGTTLNPLKLTGPVEVTALSITREVATFRGGQKVLGRRQLGVSDIGSFDLKLSAYDEAFHALVTGSAIDTSIATANSVTTPNVMNGDPPQLILLLTMGFQTLAGVNKFATLGYHNVQISEAQSGAAGQSGGENPNPTQYTVTVMQSDRTFFGLPYSATAVNAVDNSDIFMRYITAKPVSITTYKASAGATSFVLGYRPVSSENAGARNVFVENGASNHADVSGVDTTTGVVTISAASAADLWVTTYETEFRAI